MKNLKNRVILSILLLVISGCVQEEHRKKVTFTVDTNAMDSVSEVGVRGQFTSPPWQVTVPMFDKDKDGIFEVTIEDKTAQSSVEFKFVIEGDQYELECQPNRILKFKYQPEEIIYSGVFDQGDGEQKDL
ncbi:MAG: hypothetical protein AAGF96_00405 [Bacteroidota bacterium]